MNGPDDSLNGLKNVLDQLQHANGQTDAKAAAEGLRLFRAFLSIKDSRVRQDLIDLAEKFARQ